MENTNQTQISDTQDQQPVTTAVTPAVQNQPKKKTSKVLFYGLLALIVGVTGYLGATNPQLFKGDITGGASIPSINKVLYIPTDYVLVPGTVGDVAIKAGTTLTNVGNNLSLTFQYDTDKISINSASANSDEALYGKTMGTSKSGNTFTVTVTVTPQIATIAEDTTLFHLSVSGNTAFTTGSTQIFLQSGYIYFNGSAVTDATTLFAPGTIKVSANDEACKNVTCEHGTCDPTNGQCVCFKGYSQDFLCKACEVGYTGYPDCKLDQFVNLSGIVLTLNQNTISKLSVAERANVYSGAYIMINSPAVSAKTISLEGTTITIPNPTSSPCTSDVQKVTCINEITNSLKTSLGGVAGVNVTTYAKVPGLLLVQATGTNTDLDGISTTSGDVWIVPAVMSKITLNPTDTYQLRLIAKYSNDGSAAVLNYNDVTWQPQPLNRLNDTSLKAGLLEKGDKAGPVQLYAEVQKADETTVESNLITAEVPAGPIIEYIHLIGSKPLERGGRVSLSTKISDVDQISDIKDIRSSIVRTTATTYLAINNDATAVWFTATPYIDQIQTTDSGTQAVPADSTVTPGVVTPGTPTTPEVPEYYRIYTIPVEIPQDQNMTDGTYQLILQLTDVAGHVATSVMPITLGAAANGDVDGDGKVSMIDVITAFQIANGTITNPTQSQILAADMDKNGKVTMLDVITLFNQLK